MIFVPEDIKEQETKRKHYAQQIFAFLDPCIISKFGIMLWRIAYCVANFHAIEPNSKSRF